LNAFGDAQLDRFERLAAGVEFQTALGGVQRFGELVQGQAG